MATPLAGDAADDADSAVAGTAGPAVVPARDAVVRDPDASYTRAAAAPLVTPTERAVVSAQLGRPVRGDTAVVHRCAFGLPTVTRVHPRLGDGTPFPTTFWLTCPLLRSGVGRLEADGAMVAINDRIGRDEDYAAGYASAHARYVRFRDALDPERPLPSTSSIGGMPDYVKCLHVPVAQTLATGDNVVGREAFDAATPATCPAPCADPRTDPAPRNG